MKFYIEGDLTEEEFVKIGKFFAKMFKDTPKVIKIFVTEGMQYLSKEECVRILIKCFEGSKHYVKTFDLKEEDKTRLLGGEER